MPVGGMLTFVAHDVSEGRSVDAETGRHPTVEAECADARCVAIIANDSVRLGDDATLRCTRDHESSSRGSFWRAFRRKSPATPAARLSVCDVRSDVFLNGRKLGPGEQAIHDGDLLHFRNERLQWRVSGTTLSPAPILIGQSIENEVRVHGPSVGRIHAMLTAEGVLHDLGSGAGTRINSLPIRAPYRLEPGDVVRLGTKTSELDSPALHYDGLRLRRISARRAQRFVELFPHGIARVRVAQGRIGNCAFLAAFKAAAANNAWKIAEKLEIDEADASHVAVSFAGANARVALTAADDALVHGAVGDLGARVVERAFGRAIRRSDDETAFATLDEGGYTERAVAALTNGKEPEMVYDRGFPLAQTEATRVHAERLLDEVRRDPANRIAVASSIDTKFRPSRSVVPNHVYAIIAIGEKGPSKRSIVLSNPHGERQLLYTSHRGFLRNFRRLTVSQPEA